ncbi:MAG: type I phosphomannose isomerase catalytic subunit [Terracidiphilus sp.]|jgi:mannose-6-phosphate isomerase
MPGKWPVFLEKLKILMAISAQSARSVWAPFRIAPWYSERVWGFRDLHPWYDRIVADGEPIGEAWLTGDQCIVATGAHAGQTLGALFAEAHESLLGNAGSSGKADGPNASPLLIKVIFAKEKLSVQVHPDDAMAQKYGDPRGKTECWYTLSAEPGAQVALGLKPGVTLEGIKAGIEAGALESSLNLLDVAGGDMIFVDAGTVHAIFPGSILLETQQNCDLTYRMYDYGRGRELHIQKSLEATRLQTRAGKIPPRAMADRTLLMDGEYFCVERISVAGSRTSASLADESQPVPGLQYLFVACGLARIAGPSFEALKLPMGGIVAVPAVSPEFVVEDLGSLDLMRITPRWPAEKR